MFQRVKSKLGHFWSDTSGAVTVDWVVLLAGILGMIFIVMASISSGVSIFGEKAGEELATREMGTF